MPNGHPDFKDTILPEFERFFIPIAPVMLDFAKGIGVEVQKYYHQFPDWSILFRHPHGGIGKIDISRQDDDCIAVWICRWQDDYDSGVRNSSAEQIDCIDVDPRLLRPVLSRALDELLSWQGDRWDKSHSGFKDYWHAMSKEEFGRMDCDYPILKQTDG